MTQTTLIPRKWKYSFDTSAFIDSWRRYYPIDVFQNLWSIIAEKIRDHVIVATLLVKDEIYVRDDELKEFIKQFPENFIVPDRTTQRYVSEIMNDSDFEGWRRGKGNQADPFVVGLAKTNNLIVVSYENERNTKNSIPVACRKLGVEHYTFIEFLRSENITL